MTQRAVLVGINYIGTSNQLNGCINDVYRVADVLRSVYKFPSSNITILTDDQPHSSNKYPIKSNIISALQSLINNTKPGDVAVFHYSGHGTTERNNYSTDLLNPNIDDALIPVDVLSNGNYNPSKEILDEELWGIVSQLPKGAFLFSAIDACHSGTEFDLPYSLRIDPSNKSKYTLQKVERRPETQGAIVMLSGCKTDQTSLDAVDNRGKPAGALTYALCDYIIHHTNNSIHFVDFLNNIRQQIIQNNPGVSNIQEPQLDFGRMCDATLNFTLLPSTIAAELSTAEQKDVNYIMDKVRSVTIKPIISNPRINTQTKHQNQQFFYQKNPNYYPFLMLNRR